jgi:fibronectin type 3 domain-containing protein
MQLSWTDAPLSVPTSDSLRRSYRVYRRSEGSQQKILVGQRDADAEDHQSLTDQSFDWEKTYYYHADTLTVIPQSGKPDIFIEGDDTPEVKVFAHDIFPPAVPLSVEAVFAGSGQQGFIDLIWTPVTDSDLAGYNVYRRDEGSTAVKVNPELVKIPAFRDLQVVPGKKYLYSVSAVDARGNESGRSAEAAESVP